MSDSVIIIIVIFLFLILPAAGIVWLVFFRFPKMALSIARELAEAVKSTLGMTPQVTINQRIVYKQTREILELAMIEQDFDVEHQDINKWWGSTKQITLHGIYRAKIGFDLQKGFQIKVHRGRFLKPSKITIYLPRAEILSVEPLDIQKSYSSGLINWVTRANIEAATRQLAALAMDKASKLEMLADAERRIENRLNEFLLPRLISYRLGYRVEFLELAANAIGPGEENAGNKALVCLAESSSANR
jgi:hypothetical protein